MKNLLSLGLLIALAGALGSCQKSQPVAPAQAPKAKAPVAKKAPEKKAPTTSHADCVGPITTGESVNFKIADNTWVLNGSTLTMEGDKSKGLVMGVISDVKENTVGNIRNLLEFSQWFKKEKADMIVVSGDTGFSQAQIEANLRTLATAGIPVLVLVGNRESRVEFKAALTNVSRDHKHVLNFNSIRRVDTPAADLLSLPGYYDVNKLHSDDGCQYFQSDVDALAQLVKTANSPTVLVSHGGPRQEGPHGIDRMAAGDNVGDPALSQAITKLNIPFGIFGNIHEAGGGATNRDGSKRLAPNAFHDSLYLNPGPADSMRWGMNDKTESVGMAGIMTVKDGKASYRIQRAKPTTKQGG
jgi:Icc-related predicted phosphoesterase